MINILPSVLRDEVRSDYRVRFWAVSCFMGAGVLMVTAGFLVPTYYRAFSTQEGFLIQASVADASISHPGLAAASQSENHTAGLYTALQSQLSSARPSTVVDALLPARNPTILLRQIECAIAAKTATVRLSGVAATRDDLLAFKQRLEQVPGVQYVELPPASLAMASNAPFLIQVTYAMPTPGAVPTP